MQNYANTTIEGFVTQDPVSRKTKTGKNLCTFSLAINHFSKSEEDPKVSYVDVETWEKLAEICSDNIAKGRRVMVFGTLRQDRWEDSNGKKKSRIKIVGNEVRFLESSLRKRETDGQAEAYSKAV